MNKYLEDSAYFFNNIYPYLSKKEQKECLRELKKELKSLERFNKKNFLEKALDKFKRFK